MDMGPFESQECAGLHRHWPMWDNDPRSTHRAGGELGAEQICLGLWSEKAGDRLIVMQGLLDMPNKGGKVLLSFSACRGRFPRS